MRVPGTSPPSLPRRRRDRGQSVVEFALVLPIMVILMIAIVDFARIYTTMVNVESAAREAADFGTTLGAPRWQESLVASTVQEMKRRSCVALSNQPDYVDPDDPSLGNCTNPAFECEIQPSAAGDCLAVTTADGCDVATRTDPCVVTVTLTYNFSLFAPVNIEMFGIEVGFPSTVTLVRDSTYAMTDIELATPPP
jgi:Flp pilus assembly protein TadG